MGNPKAQITEKASNGVGSDLSMGGRTRDDRPIQLWTDFRLQSQGTLGPPPEVPPALIACSLRLAVALSLPTGIVNLSENKADSVDEIQ